jgi:hypothetical protein
MALLNLDIKRAKKILGFQTKPFKFEILKAPHKKFEETIVFVPFFFGKKEHMKRHSDFVNELGYDAAVFTLSVNKKFILKRIPYDHELGWGLKHVWTREISEVLDKIPGNKILFTFSNPTSSALEAARIRGHKDIKALICDGGPFYDLLKCNWNYFTYEYPIKSFPKKLIANIIARGIWTHQHEAEIYRDLSALPPKFPVLSIRGWKDPLVPPSAIEKAFRAHHHLDLDVLNLPEGRHLDGLKNYTDIYRPKVLEFLAFHSVKIKSES